MSAITLLGTPAEIYQNGTQYITLVGSYPIVMLATTTIYLPVFYKLGVSTSYEVRKWWSKEFTFGCVKYYATISDALAQLCCRPAIRLRQLGQLASGPAT